MKKIAFLDRDGVINEDYGYVHSMDQVDYVDGSIEGMKSLLKNGFTLKIITNQAGIGKGYYSIVKFRNFMKLFLEDLKRRDVTISGYRFCPHHSQATVEKYKKNCDYRKPKPKMIIDDLESGNYSVEKSIVIGDRISDVQAGIAAGIKENFLLSSCECNLYDHLTFHKVKSWDEIIEIVGNYHC